MRFILLGVWSDKVSCFEIEICSQNSEIPEDEGAVLFGRADAFPRADKGGVEGSVLGEDGGRQGGDVVARHKVTTLAGCAFDGPRACDGHTERSLKDGFVH